MSSSEEQPKKKCLNVAIIGHVNHGKSTAAGHLITQCAAIDKDAVERLGKEAVAKGKSADDKYAWILNKAKRERDYGISIDISIWQLQTPRCSLTLIDCPGLKDYIKNMITGTTQADGALLVVSVVPGEHHAGMAKDPHGEGQTREHALLACALGVKQIIVAYSKMDRIDYSQSGYETVKQEVSRYLNKVGYPDDRIQSVPISGLQGENLSERSSKMPWYEGPTLLAALDNLTTPKREEGKPLRIPVQDVFKVGGVGTVPVGRIETGILKPEQMVTFAPTNITAEVREVEMHHETVAEAHPGDQVGFNVKNIAPSDLRRGLICGPADDPPMECVSFIAQIVVMNHPGEIKSGYAPMIDCHTAHVAAKWELIAKVDRRSGKELERNPPFIKAGDCAMVKMTPLKPLCVETAEEYPTLGRLVSRDLNMTIAVGVVKSVQKKDAATLAAEKKAAARAGGRRK